MTNNKSEIILWLIGISIVIRIVLMIYSRIKLRNSELDFMVSSIIHNFVLVKE